MKRRYKNTKNIQNVSYADIEYVEKQFGLNVQVIEETITDDIFNIIDVDEKIIKEMKERLKG